MPIWLSELPFDPSDDADDDDIDPALKSTQEWAKIAGKRAKRTQEFVEELRSPLPDSLGFRMVCLCIVDEPIRFLTFEFLKIYDESIKDIPTLVMFANPERSPLVAACQYLTSLLFQRRGRTVLLDLTLKLHIRVFRRMVVLALAWVQRRHCDRLEQMPFNLPLLIDREASILAKEQLADQWDQLSPCCARPGLARSLRRRGVSGFDLQNSAQ